MIYLYISITAIVVGFLVINRHKKNAVSNISECAICNNTFLESEMYEYDDLPFCQPHYYLYKNSVWSMVKEVVTNPQNIEDGVKLYEYKVLLFTKYEIPSVIKSDYMIKGDSILTKLKLFVPDDKVKLLP